MFPTELLKQELDNRGIPYKENQQNLIIRCPVCYFRDGKDKLKLYIHKETGVFHCFRCDSKGNIFKLIKLLNKYYQIDLSPYIDIDVLLTTTYSTKFLSDTLSNIDTETTYKLISEIKKNNQTIKEVIEATKPKSQTNRTIKQVYGYLLKRGISPLFLSHIPYFIGVNPDNQRLFRRFGVFTWFYTNYEARATIKGIEPRYQQSKYSRQQLSDFVFLLPMDKRADNNIVQLVGYNEPEKLKSISLEFDELYIVEGAFDALKLNIYLNKPVISLGGWSKYKNSLIFLKTLSTLFNQFKIGKVIYLFDRDIGYREIVKVSDTIFAYSSYLPFIDEFRFIKFQPANYPHYKDVGDTQSPEELKECLKQSPANLV